MNSPKEKDTPKEAANELEETLDREEAQDLYWREGELKIVAEQAVADYKKRLVEKLEAESCQGYFRVSYSRVLELVEETD